MNRERRFLEFLKDKAAGVPQDATVPAKTTYVDTSHLDNPPARHLATGGRSRPPGGPTGTRQPTRLVARSYRSWAPVPELGRIITAESMLERHVRDVLLASPGLVDLRDQWPVVKFVDALGRERRHVFDYAALYDTGYVEAIAVKPLDRVDHVPRDGRPSLRDTIRLIEEQEAHLSVAHAVRIVTDADVNSDDAANATRLREARRYRYEPDVEAALDAARELGREFRFFELVRGSVDEWRRKQAVWALIDDGLLRAAEPGRIVSRSVLVKTEACMEVA